MFWPSRDQYFVLKENHSTKKAPPQKVQTNMKTDWQKMNTGLYFANQSYKLRHHSFWDKILIRKKFPYYVVSVSVAPVSTASIEIFITQ